MSAASSEIPEAAVMGTVREERARPADSEPGINWGVTVDVAEAAEVLHKASSFLLMRRSSPVGKRRKGAIMSVGPGRQERVG